MKAEPKSASMLEKVLGIPHVQSMKSVNFLPQVAAVSAIPACQCHSGAGRLASSVYTCN